MNRIDHGISFWKQLMAIKKAKWASDLPILPCSICGAMQGGPAPQDHTIYNNDGIEDIRTELFRYTPDTMSNESEVLIPDIVESAGYGAIDRESAPSRKSTKPKSSKGKRSQTQSQAQSQV